jgi:hydroxyethylthiazole kinase-like uncharacterized protein yjeF
MSITLPKLPSISLTAHKKTRGHALIIAGSKEKSGAAILSSLACMRSGVGLCTLVLPSAAHTLIKSQLINIMSEEIPSDEKSVFQPSGMDRLPGIFKDKSAVLMGPGLAPDKHRKTWIESIVSKLHIPFVLDAQALTDLGTDIDKIDWSKTHAIVTPHEGEMSKLTGLDVEEIHSNRSKIAQAYAKKWNVYVVLKGHETVIASPVGETWINGVDHPCLSVAGTGDVLAGILVSLLAQGVSLMDACKLSVYIHGRAGENLGEKMGVRGVLATDLLNEIPRVIHELDQDQTSNM